MSRFKVTGRANLFDVEAKDIGEAQIELMAQGHRRDAPAAAPRA
ncbi:hypothetical protein GCM10009592_12170 [Brachybacterium rhamnosum]|uniref:Uncharacterized protein n=1 Tax=Brachybacterium rhamnosum TaxID=173361 RepID=A0ABW4PXC3_9MICO